MQSVGENFLLFFSHISAALKLIVLLKTHMVYRFASNFEQQPQKATTTTMKRCNDFGDTSFYTHLRPETRQKHTLNCCTNNNNNKKYDNKNWNVQRGERQVLFYGFWLLLAPHNVTSEIFQQPVAAYKVSRSVFLQFREVHK